MKKISDKVYEADEGKNIVSKITRAKYKKIYLSQNDSIDNYEEVSDVSSKKASPAESSRKWSKSE